jgi:hypothetical protein
MIQVAANCIIELCSALLASSSGSPSHSSQDIPGLWRRTQSYRDRVIGVYVEVLGYLYKDSGQGNVYGSSTFHGNNSITGDIGNLASTTVSFVSFAISDTLASNDSPSFPSNCRSTKLEVMAGHL